jgi:phage gp46-like protein
MAMSDIALIFDPTSQTFDIGLSGSQLVAEDGLKTAIILSLFLDARAHDDDVIPDGTANRRGWYGDRIVPGGQDVAYPDRVGSRLWLLAREKQLPSVLVKARQYATEALQWLVDDGVAARVDVTAEIVRAGMLGLGVTVTRPDGSTDQHNFDYAWSNL